MLEIQSYYNNLTEAEANRCVMTVPLLVNCAGVVYYSHDYHIRRKRNDFYLLCACAGSLQVKTKAGNQVIGKDTFIIFEPDTYFEYGMKNSFINYYWLHFTGFYAGELLKSLGIPLNTVCPAAFNDCIKKLFERCFDELIFSPKGMEASLCGLLINILTELVRAGSGISHEKLKSVEYVNKNYDKNISVKQLAEMENLSASRYRTVFKKAMGMSPTEYITTMRINAAALYLQHDNMSVKETAYAVGYDDSLYFSKVFKKVTGKSPKNYRATK